MPLPIKNNLDMSYSRRSVTKQDVMDHFEDYKRVISFWRVYPDLFVDFMVKVSKVNDLEDAEGDTGFKLYPYQRMMLRSMARYTDVNLTFSRGTSKSFINVLWQIIKCILYPGTKSAICASTKGQSAKILDQKINEILAMVPAFRFELKKNPTKVKDDITILFKNGSWIMNVASKGSTRGDRQNTLTTEEIIECDADNMEAVVRPLLAISRLAGNGERDPDERIKRQEIIITTAGIRDTYSHARLMRNLIRMVTEPGKAIVLGGSYRIPILAGLQDMDWIREMKLSGTFNPASFPREFLSKWSSGSDKAFFPADSFDRLRSIQEPVFEREENLGHGVEYFFGLDVGRLSDTSEITIVKRIPQVASASMKHLVNIVTFEKMSFPEQAVKIKQLYNKYKPQVVVIDGAGVGAGLIDELVISQIDPETNAYLHPWEVINDDNGTYSTFKTSDSIKNLLYIIKANAPFNTQMYSNFQTQLLTGKLRFLVNEQQARLKTESSRAKKFKEMTDDDKLDYLLPFYQTSFLKAQMINLESSNDGINLIMKRANGQIKKDKVSSLGYVLYYIKSQLDDKEMQRNSLSFDQFLSTAKRGVGNKKSLKSRITLSGGGKYTSGLRKK